VTLKSKIILRILDIERLMSILSW